MRFLKYKPMFCLCASLLAFSSIAKSPSASIDNSIMDWVKDKPYHITILHTNDHHGRFWQNEIGEYGLSAQKTVIDGIRKEVAAEGGTLLLLSGGDINTGVPESDVLHAEPDFKGMSKIGYDAMAVGNHEFDHDLSVIRKQQSWVDFPFLSSNIYLKETNERIFSPYKIFNQNGVKIAVFGLTTEDTPILASPKNSEGLEFRKPLLEAEEIIAELKVLEKPDVIIAVTHMGHYENGNYGSMAPGDVTLARGLPNGDLDMIVGGHSQNVVCMANSTTRITEYEPGTPCSPDKQNGTWIVQAHEWGKYVGRADFVFLNGELTLKNYQLIPINLKKEVDNGDGTKRLDYYTQEIVQDKEMLALLKPFQDKGQEQFSVVIGSLEGRLEGERNKVRYEQTNLGQLLLSAFMEKTHADVGIMAGGMIRDTLIEGDITYRDVLKVEPFGNTVVYFDLTGKALLDYLQVAVNMKQGAGAYAHFRNLTIIMDGNKVTNAEVNQQPLDLDKTYRVVSLDYLAAGGDGYPKVSQLPTFVDTGYRDADVVKQYFENHSPINASDYEPEPFIFKK